MFTILVTDEPKTLLQFYFTAEPLILSARHVELMGGQKPLTLGLAVEYPHLIRDATDTSPPRDIYSCPS